MLTLIGLEMRTKGCAIICAVFCAEGERATIKRIKANYTNTAIKASRTLNQEKMEKNYNLIGKKIPFLKYIVHLFTRFLFSNANPIKNDKFFVF